MGIGKVSPGQVSSRLLSSGRVSSGQGSSGQDGSGQASVARPSRLRSFDPVRLADLEYRAWVGYYLHQWARVLIASVGLVRMAFGMDWVRTLHGAWLMLRASQLWAPYPDNHPRRAEACMRRFYALIRLGLRRACRPGQGG